MISIYSKLEDNEFSGVLLKKGKNLINDIKLVKLLSNKEFNNYTKQGFIILPEKTVIKNVPIEEPKKASNKTNKSNKPKKASK